MTDSASEMKPARKPRPKRVPPVPPEGIEKRRGRYTLDAASGPGIEHMKVADLRPWPNNARVHTKSQVEEIAASIRADGFNDPVEIDEGNVILAGHGRVMAANMLKLETVPCVRHTHLTQTQKRRYVLRNNQTALNAEWDKDLLVGELKLLDDDEVDLRSLGFDDDIIKAVLAEELELPDLGDNDGPETTGASTEEGTAPPEDHHDANAEREEEGGDSLMPREDAEKPRYHQLPPDEASRAIRASEERIPLGVLLNRDEYAKWEERKKTVGAKTDKEAFQVVMGWKQIEPPAEPTATAKVKRTNTKQVVPDDE